MRTLGCNILRRWLSTQDCITHVFFRPFILHLSRSLWSTYNLFREWNDDAPLPTQQRANQSHYHLVNNGIIPIPFGVLNLKLPKTCFPLLSNQPSFLNCALYRTDKTVIGCSGFHGDCLTLTKIIEARLKVDTFVICLHFRKLKMIY